MTASLRMHFSSGISGAWVQLGLPSWTGLRYVEEATRHATTPGDRGAVHELSSISDLHDQLEGMRPVGGQRWSYMDFHSHGTDGAIVIGNRLLTSWNAFMNRYEDLFEAGAAIEFHGCWVASGGKGEWFLHQCARTFLGARGGTVVGYRSLAWSSPFHGAPGHTPGNARVEARIRPGGTPTLHSPQYLVPATLQERCRDVLHRLRVQLHHRRLGSAEVRTNIARDAALAQVTLDRLARTTRTEYAQLFDASQAVESIESRLGAFGDMLTTNPYWELLNP